MINKIKIIAFSRFKKPNEESWVDRRRSTCASCKWNTLNQERLSLKVRIIKWLSDTFSFLSGNKEVDTLGNCTACEVCSIYYKSAESVEECEKGKWEHLNY